MKKNYNLISIFLFCLFFSQEKVDTHFREIKKNYQFLAENDLRAFPSLNRYIYLAKTKKNYDELTKGYEDAVYFSKERADKLKYSDSAIIAANLSQKIENISRAHLGKGIVFYFNFKKYKPALEEYLKAYQYSEKSSNPYLQHEIIYHIGVVKSYLGYSDAALSHFSQANQFFEANLRKSKHPNEIYNNEKGALNTLHRMIVCYRNLGKHRTADSLIDLGLMRTSHSVQKQEYGYFLKEKGIRQYLNKNYNDAISNLKEGVKNISEVNDFAWIAVSELFIGKAYLELKDDQKAIECFKEVDSIIIANQFMIPELRENYEILIDYFKKKDDAGQQLYYTQQLVKADRIIAQDFTDLSARIHREYDTKVLEKEKDALLKTTSFSFVMVILVSVAALLMLLMMFRRYRNDKQLKINYKILEEKIITDLYAIPHEKKIALPVPHEDRAELGDDLVQTILKKLKKFEDDHKFTEAGLTIQKLAAKLHTNSTYLSQIIREQKGVNFAHYLADLRIRYITNKLYTDKIYLSYKIETLAEKCGIASRTNFSNLFQEVNGMRPAEFIKKRLKDLQSESSVNPNSNQTSSGHPDPSEQD